MEVLSFVVLILLSLVGYSAGAAGRAGKNTDLKPTIMDLMLVAFIWVGAIYTRLVYDFNKWLLILVWVAVSAVLGLVAVSFRRLSRKIPSTQEDPDEVPSAFFKRLWHRWTGFSKRMGSFQSRIILSFFFFVLISPAALIIKVLGDPLRIKKIEGADSHWLAKTPSSQELEDFRRQF